MPKTLSILWIHVVWSTKNRSPMIRKSVRGGLNNYIKATASKKGIRVDTVNGMSDHIHVLIQLRPTQSVSGVVKYIKGVSSRWLNENHFKGTIKFQWQEGYGVFSVSKDDVNSVRSYIYNQEKHHSNITFQNEIRLMTNS